MTCFFFFSGLYFGNTIGLSIQFLRDWILDDNLWVIGVAHTNRLEPWWNFLNVSDSSHASSVTVFFTPIYFEPYFCFEKERNFTCFSAKMCQANSWSAGFSSKHRSWNLRFSAVATGGKKHTHIHNAGMCELPMCDKFGKDAVDSELASGCPKTSKSIWCN